MHTFRTAAASLVIAILAVGCGDRSSKSAWSQFEDGDRACQATHKTADCERASKAFNRVVELDKAHKIFLSDFQRGVLIQRYDDLREFGAVTPR
jgi:hypothetical protein